MKLNNFTLTVIASMIATWVFGISDTLPGTLEILGRIESKRKDALVTILFDREPAETRYGLIENGDIIGTVEIVKVGQETCGKGICYRAIGRYFLMERYDDSLVRSGLAVGMESTPREKTGVPEGKPNSAVRAFKKEIISVKDSREMVLVPGGKFVFGSGDGDPDELPEQILDLPDFYMDRYEVSNADYQAYVNEMKAPSPRTWNGGTFPSGEDRLPVIVSFREADAYARWAKKRLPTEEEWEKAARGPGLEYSRTGDGIQFTRKPLRFPWGNRYRPEYANTMDFWKDAKSREGMKLEFMRGYLPVTMFDGAGNSPYGVVNMSGNAIEWTSSWYKAYGGSKYTNGLFGTQVKVLRGGGWYSSMDEVRGSRRQVGGMPGLGEDAIGGIRCAKPPDVIDAIEQ